MTKEKNKIKCDNLRSNLIYYHFAKKIVLVSKFMGCAKQISANIRFFMTKKLSLLYISLD